MKRIVITEFMDETAVDGLKDSFEVIYDPNLVDREEELFGLLEKADAIIVRNRTQVRGKLLEAAPYLKVVGRLGVGLDNIDMSACKDREIEVFPATGANDAAVAEYVITVVMMLFRRAYLSFIDMADGTWPRTQLMGNETSGKTLGLVGYGGIARETATRAVALGMKILAYDPYLPADHPAWTQAEKVELDRLLKEADAVSLHVPLTAETQHLIDEKAISTMKKDAIVINASRGGVVDDQALVAALKSERLAGAALDVYEVEPLTEEFGKQMKELKNLVLTPHIGGVTIESNIRVSAVTAQNVRQALGEKQ
ncbi:MAG: hydroxyacid dehydrogenase [Proteobacteria bacterium]|nr:hydroxyacid dehydrogenase [Pseudomonadota bacterium]